MKVRNDIENYLAMVERYAGKKLRYRAELGMLMAFAHTSSRAADFERVVFLAKFVTRGFDILRRSGIPTSDTKYLADEVRKNLEEVVTLLRNLCSVNPDAADAVFGDRFFALSHESLALLQEFLSELTWIKNYSLEGHPLPIGSSPRAGTPA